MATQLETLFNLIDEANSADPVLESAAGATLPRALLYGQRMSACLATLRPDAPAELRIAARAQHLCRWQIPRDHYPAGRAGYLKWRRDLARFHARLCADLMRQLEMDESGIERVQQLLQKKNLKQDPDTQTLEDAACLVFLQYYLEDLCSRQAEEKIIAIIAKTWRKMSAQGRNAALELKLDPARQHLVEAALAQD